MNILLASPLLTAGLSYLTFNNSNAFKSVTTKLPKEAKTICSDIKPFKYRELVGFIFKYILPFPQHVYVL